MTRGTVVIFRVMAGIIIGIIAGKQGMDQHSAAECKNMQQVLTIERGVVMRSL